MKQTKPYGRAQLTSAERELLARQETKPSALQATRSPDTTTGSPDLFDLGGDSLNTPQEVASPRKQSSLRAVTGYAVALSVALTVFVLVRDSLLMARVLEQLSSREAVMVCKDGTMHYTSNNPLDRLLGKGQFVCTEWSIQRGMLSIPRPYY